MKLTNKQYDAIKWVVFLLLPGVSTLVLTLSDTWGFEYAVPVAATISAFSAFLGTITGVSSIKYANTDKDSFGTIYVGNDEAYASFNEDPASMVDKKIKMEVKSTE